MVATADAAPSVRHPLRLTVAIPTSLLIGLLPGMAVMARVNFNVELTMRLALISAVLLCVATKRPLIAAALALPISIPLSTVGVIGLSARVSVVIAVLTVGATAVVAVGTAVVRLGGPRVHHVSLPLAGAGVVAVGLVCPAAVTGPWTLQQTAVSAMGSTIAVLTLTPAGRRWFDTALEAISSIVSRTAAAVRRAATTTWHTFDAIAVGSPPATGGTLRARILDRPIAPPGAAAVVGVLAAAAVLTTAAEARDSVPVGVIATLIAYLVFRRRPPSTVAVALATLPFPVTAWAVVAGIVNRYGYGDGILGTTGAKRSWDYSIYREVAERGYVPDRRLEAVFPMQPLVVRALHVVGMGYDLAAVALSTTGGLVATALFWNWLGLRGINGRARNVSLVLFLLYPYAAIMFGGGYPDSMLVAFALGAFLLAECDRPWLAGLVGALATFTRPNSLPIVPALLLFGLLHDGVVVLQRPSASPGGYRSLYRSLSQATFHRDNVRWRSLAPLTSLLGVGSYSAWLWGRTGDPLYFWTVQTEFYAHKPLSRLTSWTKYDFLVRPQEWVAGRWQEHLDEVGTTVCVVVALALLPALARRFGWAYTLLVAGLLAVFVGGGDRWLTPGARLLLPAFPVAAIAGEWLARRRRLWLPAATLLLAWLLFVARGFATGKCCW